jgi:hypothetical protein
VRSLGSSALLNALYHRQQFERLDISNRVLFEPGEYVVFKATDDLVAMTTCPRRLMFGEPLARNRLESV